MGARDRWNGIIAVHGRVHVVSSATVNSYWSRSGLTRVKRSTRCRFSWAPRKLLFGEKFVVSTTSVSPSQCPRESPSQLLNPAARMRPAVERDDARVVDRLHAEHDGVARLDDVVVAHVRRLRSRHAERDAALAQRAILWAGGKNGSRRSLGGRASRRGRRERRDSSVGRVSNQGRPVVEDAIGQPELVVVAGSTVARRELVGIGQERDEQLVAERGVAVAVEQPRRACFQRRDLRFGQRGPAGELRRAARAASRCCWTMCPVDRADRQPCAARSTWPSEPRDSPPPPPSRSPAQSSS